MKKRIIGIFGLMTGLSLIIGGGILLKAENTDDYGQAVAMANNTEDAGMILIEEEEVPLTATIPSGEDEMPLATAVPAEEGEASDEEVSEEELPENDLVQETTAPKINRQPESVAETEEPQEESGVLPCLTDGNHHGVWTDCGDYKVMKCADCGQEISERANRLADGVYGYYRDDAAMLLFAGVNRGRSGFELSGTLHEIAKDRALDCVGDFSHDDMLTFGECIAKGQADAEEAIASWNASEYHRDLLFSSMYTEGGSSCLWYDSGNGNMKSIWVMVLN